MAELDEVITSRQNPKIKAIVRQLKKPSEADFVLVEGEKHIGQAIRSGAKPLSVWTTRAVSWPFPGPQFRVSESVFQAMAVSRHPQPVLALFPRPELRDSSQSLPARGRFLLLDQVQDPGNGGALVRAAVAFGLSGVIWREPCLFPFHPKCTRASAGSVFQIAHYRLGQDADRLPAFPILTTGVDGAIDVAQFTWPKDFVLALGNEGHGVSRTLRHAADTVLRVPFPGDVESLNVTGAAHILLFSWARMTAV